LRVFFLQEIPLYLESPALAYFGLLRTFCDRVAGLGDRCQAFRRAVLRKTFFDISGHSRKNRKIMRQFYKLMKLAA